MARMLQPLFCVCLLLVTSSLFADETATQQKSSATAKKTTTAVLPVFRLQGAVTEKPLPEDFPFAFGGAQGESLLTLLNRLEKAKSDPGVPGIVLELNNVTMGRAQREEVIQSLRELKKAGKGIHVHTEQFTTSDLGLLGHATDLSMVPTGYMFITGMYGEQLFLRGMLDKLGVIPDYFTCGDYKTAAEMFMRTEPSAESSEMMNWLLDSLFASVVKNIADARGVSEDVARSWIDTGVYTAERAVEAGIIDVVEHQQDFEQRLRDVYGDDLKFDRRYGRKKGTQIDLSSPFGILNFYAELLSPSPSRRSTKPGVGVVYLEGAIMPGSSGGNPLLEDSAAFSDAIRKALDEAADDDALKAVVFRVNSPGGSAVASEVILNAARRVAAKKPLIVSMGDVAASGGYYVACGTDRIFAEPSTVTGSIGVVVGKFATTQLWNRLGITFTPSQRGQNAAMLSSASVFSDSERAAMRGYMDEVYEVFKGHVTAARGDRLRKPIDDLAGGRVYTGLQAKELGLVDQIGGLKDAVAEAGRLAELEDGFDVRVVPHPKNFMEMLMSDLTGGNDSDDGHLHLDVKSLMLQQLQSDALSMLATIDPSRASAIRQAMLQLHILQKERVSLTMPALHLSGP